MKQQKKSTKNPWNLTDPKPPVIQSGHMENHLEITSPIGDPPVDRPEQIL